MTLQQINYFLTISESRSMNRAAEKLFIAQPTLTGAVRDVENELGIQIFHRTHKGVTTTQRVINRLLRENELEFTSLIECPASVYLARAHPLAGKK